MYTNQTAFDKVYKHLLTQNSQAMNADGTECAYRGSDGKMCAVGCLITDADYDPIMEGDEATWVIRDIDELSYVDSSLLNALQRMHDTGSPVMWRDKLQTLAIDYGLTVPKDLT